MVDIQVISCIELRPGDDSLRGLLAEAEAELQPCTRAEAEEALGHTIAIMGCRRPSEVVCEGYLYIMQRYPRKLLMPSVALAIARERYHVLPAVGALVAKAERELEGRRSKLLLLKLAISRLELRRKFIDKAQEYRREARLKAAYEEPS